MANAAERVYSLIKQTVEQEGVELWDVRFVKEGSSWYLRVFIDKAEGITIDDCTNVSHAIDRLLMKPTRLINLIIWRYARAGWSVNSPVFPITKRNWARKLK